MILKRVLSAAAAAGAVLAGAGVTVVAASYALYAWMTAYLPRAGAAAVVAAVFAVLVVAVALVAVNAAKGKPKPSKVEPQGTLLDRGIALAKERPLTAAVGALAAGLIAVRNPALIALALGAADSRAPKKTR